jgi:hypothetical protein
MSALVHDLILCVFLCVCQSSFLIFDIIDILEKRHACTEQKRLFRVWFSKKAENESDEQE